MGSQQGALPLQSCTPMTASDHGIKEIKSWARAEQSTQCLHTQRLHRHPHMQLRASSSLFAMLNLTSMTAFNRFLTRRLVLCKFALTMTAAVTVH